LTQDMGDAHIGGVSQYCENVSEGSDNPRAVASLSEFATFCAGRNRCGVNPARRGC
jgi:hypothetical protein